MHQRRISKCLFPRRHFVYVLRHSPFSGKDISMFSFLLFFRGGGGVEDGLEVKDTGLDSVESNVSLEEMSQ